MSESEFGGPEDFTLNMEKYMRQTPPPTPKHRHQATVENAEDVESPIRLPAKDLEIRELKAELEATEAGNASIRKALETERKENEILRRKLEDATSFQDVLRLIKTVEKENSRLTASNERLQGDNSELSQKLQEAASNHEMLETEVVTLRDSLAAYDNDHSSHQSTLASLKASHQCTITALKASHKEQLQDIECRYTEKLEDLKSQHAEERDDLTSRQTHQLVDLEERHENEATLIKADLGKKHESEFSLLKTSHAEQINNMKENIAKADRLMRDHDAKREVLVQSLRTRGDTLEKDLKNAKADHETAINKSVTNMKATLAKADHLMREHDAKRDRQAQRLQERIRDLEKGSAAASVKATTNSSVTKLQSKLAALTKEYDTMKTNLDTANTRIATLTKEHDITKTQLDIAHTRIANLMREQNYFKDELAARNTVIADCSRFCDKIEAEQDAEIQTLKDAHREELTTLEQHWSRKYAKLSKSMDICDNELRRLWGREELGDTTEGGTKPQRYRYKYVNKHGELNAAGRELLARRASRQE
ncbi:MAG: hypothetical protein Q9191_004298 [Dirinaria sp. TL-2023a]